MGLELGLGEQGKVEGKTDHSSCHQHQDSDLMVARINDKEW